MKTLPFRSSTPAVLKFGGALLGTPELLLKAASLIASRAKAGEKIVVVVSAMGNDTDRLLQLARETKADLGSASVELDVVLAAGEQISAGLMALALQTFGVPARSFLAHQVPIQCSGAASDASLCSVRTENLRASIEADQVPVVAGFQGVDEQGRILTLGRGGSDTTAVAVAAALGARLCEFFKDVDGVYSTDPQKNLSAQKFSQLNYQQMELLAQSGAQVLHHKAVVLAREHRVSLYVRSLSNAPGTLISARSSNSLSTSNSLPTPAFKEAIL